MKERPPAVSQSKRVGMRTVAKLAGVSRTTVSMVLNNSPIPTAATRNKVLQAVNQLGYQLSPVFRNAFKGPRNAHTPNPKTGTIGFLTSERILPHYKKSDSYYSRLRHGVETALNAVGYDLMIRSVPQTQTGLLPMVSEGKVDGLIAEATLNPDLALLLTNHVPVVFLEIAPPRGLTADWVKPNIHAAVRTQIDHLLALGHQSIATFQPNNRGLQEDEFLAAYLSICGEQSLATQVFTKTITPNNHEATMEKLAASIATLPNPPTALITWDTYACTLLTHWETGPFRIPTHLSVVGMDDSLPGRFSRPPLDSYAFPLHQMGETAAELLLARILQPDRPVRTVELTGNLITRQSSAPPD